MTRLLLLLALLLALAAPSAQAQNTPFGPVPTATPKATTSSGAGDDTGRSTLYVIAGGVFLFVVAIGYAISRDARRSLTAEDREALEREEAGRPASEREVKPRSVKQRKRQKAARQARKHNRPK
jgi:hypothetical protein